MDTEPEQPPIDGGADGADGDRNDDPGRSGRPRPTRRWVLAGAGAVVVGGAAGMAAQLLTRGTLHEPAAPPRALVDAAHAERSLIADLDATTGGTADVRRVIVAARADHAAHLATLQGLLAGYRRADVAASSAASASSASSAPGTPRTAAELRAAERRAAGAAAARATALHGPAAAVLASIAACEATHADLLR